MRKANEKQRTLLLHIIGHLLSEKKSPLQIFFTGPAGCGKTFVIKLIMEIYNRFSNTDGYCNAYITCASTGKAAIAIEGTTVHTALRISLSRLLPLSNEIAQLYRCLFKFVKVLIIDEISMVSAELLSQIDARLKQITGNFQSNFGGLDIVLIGDLRQLPPVRATPIYKSHKQRMVGPTLWRDLKFYELTEVMRQTNVMFSSILTKIGNGDILNDDEIAIIQSRFVTKEEAQLRCPHGIRLFLTNNAVNEYNNYILHQSDNRIISTATDAFIGCASPEQQANFTQKLHKMSVIDTGSLPYQIIFVINKFYIITTNIDVVDGLANGAVGKLVHIEQNEQNEITRIWLEFANSPKTGEKLRKKAAAFMVLNNVPRNAVPISRRTATIPLNNNKTIVAKRSHFPLISACAMTIHKSQGGTFDEIVYEYDKSHCRQLLYVALTRVTSLQGLYIVTKNNNDFTFYHGRKSDGSMKSLQDEFRRLSLNSLATIDQLMSEFLSKSGGLSLLTFNCQSIRAHYQDIVNKVTEKCDVLVLTETWLDDDSGVEIPHFICVSQLKRPTQRAGGVAVYRNIHDNNNVITYNNIDQVHDVDISFSSVGDLCSVTCETIDGKTIIIVAVYISNNQTIENIIKFIRKKLFFYTKERSASFGDLTNVPLILTGDFNVNFANDSAQPLLHYLYDQLQLEMVNKRTEATTTSGSTIDAVFSRFINDINSKTYVSYYSYHKPILTVVKCNEPGISITEV